MNDIDDHNVDAYRYCISLMYDIVDHIVERRISVATSQASPPPILASTQAARPSIVAS
jgi:hypothetical protein